MHRRGERLRAAHAAEPCGKNKPAGKRTTKMPTGDRTECLVRALHNALRTDVDPRAGSHLAVHREPHALELAKVIPSRPAADKIRVGNQYARRVGVRAKHADRLAALHEQCLVIFQRAQRCDDRIETVPVAGRFSGAAIHHQVTRSLRNFGIQVVHQHAERRFLLPAFTRKRCAAWRAYNARTRQSRGDQFTSGRHTITNSPRAIASASAPISGASVRSSPRGSTKSRTRRWASSTPRPGLSGAR